MTDGRQAPAPATAHVVGEKRRIPAIWIIPALAIVIGIWLAWNTISKEGPTITVTFEAAGGLKAGESDVKYKDISIGTIKSLAFSQDHTRIIVTIGTTSEASSLLTDDSEFWIVRPQLFAGSLRGIGTLISGPYIELRPGKSASTARRAFVGLEDPPVLATDVPGTSFLVRADRLGSISVGSPVFFRDLTVGEVLGWDLGDMAKSAMIHLFVRHPFDSYVRESSRFWDASGVSVKVGGAGVEVQVESLRAILLGGIGFDTPDVPAVTRAPQAGQVFPLYANREVADEASYGRKVPLVAYFPGSVRGVAVGNEVTLRGLKVGHITGVSVTYNQQRDEIVAPIHFEVEPERLVGIGKRVAKDVATGVNDLVKRGLRATLQSGSLITGQMLVALEFKPDAPPAEVTMEDGSFVIPTASGGGFGGLQDAATDLLRKVNTMPFDQIGQSVEHTLDHVDNLTRGPELKQSLTALTATLQSTQDMMRKLDTDASPAFKRLPEIVANLQGTMANANQLVASLDNGYGENTKFSRDLSRLMTELNDAVRSLHALTDLLARHPEALIRGRSSGGTE